MSTDQNSQPLVSIITATYNAEKTLRACLDSVASQDYPNLEHILVDAASTDGTLGILQQADSSRLRWTSEPDQGIYDAWNKGLRIARGEWIAFLGADDIYLPGAVAAYMDLASAHPEADYLSSQVEHVSTRGHTRLIGQPWAWPRFQRFMTVAHVGSMHRRRLYDANGDYDTTLRIVADYEFLLRPGSSLRAAFLPRATVRMQGGGVSDSAAALDEAALVKHRTGKRNRLLAQAERVLAAWNLNLRRAGLRGK